MTSRRERFGAGDRRIRSQDDCFETRLFMPKAQQGMKIRNIDPALALQSMTYYLTVRNIQKAGAGGAAMASRD